VRELLENLVIANQAVADGDVHYGAAIALQQYLISKYLEGK
jgi:hypothetical protein